MEILNGEVVDVFGEGATASLPSSGVADIERIGVCVPQGFRAAGVAAGIKAAGKPDLALVVSDYPAVAAGVLTSNRMTAAAVELTRKHLSCGSVRAVVLTAGNANAATGAAGKYATQSICKAVADAVRCRRQEVLIAQSGPIGKPFPVERGVLGVSQAAADLSSDGGLDAARAIKTTDTVSKVISYSCQVGGVKTLIGGMGKGSAMLAPSLTSLIIVLTSDVNATPAVLQGVIDQAVAEAFPAFGAPGCGSTNDTILLVANGASGSPMLCNSTGRDYRVFAETVTAALRDLALQLARDVKGASKFITVTVSGASSREEAGRAASAVAGSSLVQGAVGGEMPYWGRILSELGASGVVFCPREVEIRYGDVAVCRRGVRVDCDEVRLMRYLTGSSIEINVSIGSGPGSASAYGCDAAYLCGDENVGG